MKNILHVVAMAMEFLPFFVCVVLAMVSELMDVVCITHEDIIVTYLIIYY